MCMVQRERDTVSMGSIQIFLIHIWERNRESVGDRHVFTPCIFLGCPQKQDLVRKLQENS
jgi:hypothetical protein